MEWCTIESDPGVFTELIEAMGVKTPVEVSEVVDMDQLGESDGCRGLILLFRYDKGAMAPTDSSATVGTADPSVFFCKQVSGGPPRPAAQPTTLPALATRSALIMTCQSVAGSQSSGSAAGRSRGRRAQILVRASWQPPERFPCFPIGATRRRRTTRAVPSPCSTCS